MTHQQWESIARSLAGLTAAERREVADWIIDSIHAAGAVADRAGRQRSALAELCGRLDALPATEPGDGLTNRDHDRIVYSS